MKAETKTKAFFVIQATAVAALLVLICPFAFDLIGNIAKQLAVCVFGSLFVCVAVYSKRSQTVIGFALVEFVLFWVITALRIETQLQLEAGWVFRWIPFFYFDKLLVIGTIWLSCTLFCSVKRLLSAQQGGYERFFRLSSTAFVLFYIALLLYSFILIRLPGADDNNSFPLNTSLLSTLNMYFDRWSVAPYEMFMMLCGNMFYFTPLGYIFCVKMRGRKPAVKLIVLAAFPLLAFSALEYSQYLLQIGYCEIDDMLMNTFGFWLGAALHPLSNRIASALTKQKVKYFWG